ncbi:hypothetical protein RHSIM_Rhsim08G0135800 [Rhododendron simsii]|uniref:Uncharacterized protein n=1 Tax=Rhododendron simsii TaxID=118357 RepID=A0A834GRE1_RHOSS|nr:hypothetical protein RHSIM_Rhsim08G0135800 [Rhododendron simsii]
MLIDFSLTSDFTGSIPFTIRFTSASTIFSFLSLFYIQIKVFDDKAVQGVDEEPGKMCVLSHRSTGASADP